ncbi:MAG: 8-amino-7-oxononanoate synthase [Pseudomonadota bacterium]
MARPTETLAERLERARAGRRQQGRERRRRPLELLPGLRARVGDRILHNFSSNDYLGLAVTTAAPDGHTGSGASALVTGYHQAHKDLEQALADWLGREAVVLASSGFLANQAAITALAQRGDTVVQDRLCHASLIDAARLSGARLKRYRHGSAEAALAQLEGADGHRLLVTDGVFSMDGDAAPLAALASVARETAATLLVDDAHGIGVLGPEGRGVCGSAGLGPDDVPILIGTLGKAFGCAGAFIAGTHALTEHLENHARSLIYSTSLPPATARAAHRALHRIRTEAALRDRLQEHIQTFRSGAAQRGIPLLPSATPIQPLLIGDERDALAVSAALETQGYLVTAIRPPTVPAGTSRLRMTLSAGHEPAQVHGLLEALERSLAAASGVLTETPAPVASEPGQA